MSSCADFKVKFLIILGQTSFQDEFERLKETRMPDVAWEPVLGLFFLGRKRCVEQTALFLHKKYEKTDHRARNEAFAKERGRAGEKRGNKGQLIQMLLNTQPLICYQFFQEATADA